MATFKATGPNGEVYRFNAPDDTTPEMANEVASQYISQASQAPPHTGKLEKSDLGETLKGMGEGVLKGFSRVGRTAMNVLPAAVELSSANTLKHLPVWNKFREHVRGAEADAKAMEDQITENAKLSPERGWSNVTQFAPDVAVGAGVTGPVRAGVKALATAFPKTKKFAPSMTVGGVGATEGAITSPDEPLKGALINAGLGLGFHTAAKAATGVPRAADADILTSAGTDLTAGMAADKRTFAGRAVSRAENAMTSLPIVGDMIRGQQQRGLDTFRRGAIDRGQAPGGTPLKPGQSVDQMVEQQADDYRKLYGQAVQGKVFKPDPVFESKVTRIINDPDLTIGPAERAKIEDHIQRAVFNQARAAPFPQHLVGNKIIVPGAKGIAHPPGVAQFHGEQLMAGQASLRKAAFKYMKSQDAITRDMGYALKDVADEIYEMMGRQDPATGKLLEGLRGPYSAHKTVSSAAQRATAVGEFTPRQLAVQAGKTANRDLETYARAGSELLPSNVPDSGTATRLMWGLLAYAQPKAAIPAAAAGLGFGTRTGQRLLQGDTAGQRKLAELLKHLEVQ